MKMRSPIRALVGNLMWTRTGTVWVMWRLQPIPYGFRPTKDKANARLLHQGLLRALPGESLLLGVCSGMDPAAVVERMIEGVDLEHAPDWAAECEATLDSLDQVHIGQRSYWLAVPLHNLNPRDRALEPWKSAVADFGDAFGLPYKNRIADKDITRRTAQAHKLLSGIPASFRPEPATPAQMVWLHLHAQQRGLFADLSLPEIPGGVAEELLTPKSGSALGEPVLDEGGQSDLDRKQQRLWNPLKHRYLKVIQPSTPGHEEVASYQALLVLSDAPETMTFPGTEILGRIDECGLEVDWAIRLEVRSSAQVAKANQNALNNLNEQFDQREDELSHGLQVLRRAADDLAEYVDILGSDKLEVEAQATIVFAVGSNEPGECVDQARHLADYFAAAGFKVQQPLGGQEDLWWSMMPGAPANRATREFAQIATSRALSGLVPLASTDLGDLHGSCLGYNISSGRLGIVMHDIAGAALQGVSGSIGIVGNLGAGKSLTMKKLAGDVIDRGGLIVVPDRTAVGEWAHWARSVTDAVLVDVDEPQVSLDPLRMFGAKSGSRITQSFLGPLLNVSPQDDLGVLLSEVLATEYLTSAGLNGLGDLLEHLRHDCTIEGAQELARKMGVFARRDFGAVIFDNALPTLRLAETSAIVIRTHTLEMPTADELEREHLFRQLRLEKIFGRAMYALIAGMAREVCFNDLSRLGVLFVDEAHFMTSSPEGVQFLVEFVRDGRKHWAAVVLGSHDPEADFGSETLRGLIPIRILMRHTDKTLARRGLRWLDMDPDDNELVDIVTTDTSPKGPHGVPEHRRGEGFMRDANGNVGRLKVLAPAVSTRNQAARTSPQETQATVEAQATREARATAETVAALKAWAPHNTGGVDAAEGT